MNADRIRMLFIPNETYPTSRVDVAVLFARELHARGHRIDFVMQAGSMDASAAPDGWQGRSVWVGPTDTRNGLVHSLHRNWLSLVHDLRSLARLKDGDYNAVQVRDKFVSAVLALGFARSRGLPFFYWLSFPKPEMQKLRASQRTARYPWLTGMRGCLSGWLLYRWILPRSDHVFVQSPLMKEQICRRGIEPRKVTPVPMGVDLDELGRAGREVSRLPGERVRLAYLGSASLDRHAQILVDTLYQVRQRGVDAVLTIIGDANTPAERAVLERRAADLGVLRELEITGFLPRPRALALAAGADVCLSPIFPSPVFLVASPTKLVEYLALGVPVVANDHPEQREVLRESRAGVCTPWGSRHFARAIQWLAGRSAAQRQSMGARGRAWVEAHRTYARIADEIERIYLQRLTERVPRAVAA